MPGAKSPLELNELELEGPEELDELEGPPEEVEHESPVV